MKTTFVIYFRRYARYFPGPLDEMGKQVAAYALSQYLQWEEKIQQWQAPILNNRLVLKSRLQNQLTSDVVEIETLKKE